MKMDFDYQMLLKAIELSKKSPRSLGSFSVGAIITLNGNVIASGFTREMGGPIHAEEVALKKAKSAGKKLIGATIYSSLEPCGERLSGRESCSLKIIKAGIKRVVFALKEPPTFVEPKGMQILNNHSIQIRVIEELAPFVEDINKHLIERD